MIKLLSCVEDELLFEQSVYTRHVCAQCVWMVTWLALSSMWGHDHTYADAMWMSEFTEAEPHRKPRCHLPLHRKWMFYSPPSPHRFKVNRKRRLAPDTIFNVITHQTNTDTGLFSFFVRGFFSQWTRFLVFSRVNEKKVFLVVQTIQCVLGPAVRTLHVLLQDNM